MPFPVVIAVTETQPAEMAPAAWQRELKAAHQAEARQWVDEMLPGHFKPQAKGIYGYQPRQRRYILQKIRYAQAGKVLDGGLADLVYSGDLRNWVLSTPRIRATANAATVVMSGPRYLWMVPKNNKQPDKAGEILRVIDPERQRLADAMDKLITERIHAWREPKTTTIAA